MAVNGARIGVAWEYQRAPDGRWVRALHTRDGAAAKRAFAAAEAAWGGPLPGIVRAISPDPLRVELHGWPPARFVEAACAGRRDFDRLSHYWQLRLDGPPVVGVYHSMLHLAPLPALPAGLAVCPDTTCLRSLHRWEDGARIGPLRLYAAEARAGAVGAAWPDLCPREPAGRHGYYGLDYDPATLRVCGVQVYRADPGPMPPMTRWLGETVGWLGRR